MTAGPPRILVVDDQPDTLALAACVLDGAGYAAETAGSGAEALELLSGSRFDALLLDIDMPGLDGWEVLRRMRADHELARLPVLMFSVKGRVEDKLQGLQAGAVDYVTKPFEVGRLLEQVRRVLEAGSPT